MTSDAAVATIDFVYRDVQFQPAREAEERNDSGRTNNAGGRGRGVCACVLRAESVPFPSLPSSRGLHLQYRSREQERLAHHAYVTDTGTDLHLSARDWGALSPDPLGYHPGINRSSFCT